MNNSNASQKTATQPKKVIFRPDALEKYSRRQQKDVWPHLKLPGYIAYLWLLLGLLLLTTLVIAISINLTLAAEMAVY